MKNILIGPRPILGRSAAQLLVRCFALIVLFCSVSIASATSIDLVNNDDPGEGFSSNAAPFAGQTGNNGSTLGEQRLNVFQAAADYWEAKIESTVPIKIAINFDPLPCNDSGAVLGAAGPNSAFRDFQNAPIANIWYVAAVANSLAGSDLDGMSDDIGATFNSDIDNNNNCLSVYFCSYCLHHLLDKERQTDQSFLSMHFPTLPNHDQKRFPLPPPLRSIHTTEVSPTGELIHVPETKRKCKKK